MLSTLLSHQIFLLFPDLFFIIAVFMVFSFYSVVYLRPVTSENFYLIHGTTLSLEQARDTRLVRGFLGISLLISVFTLILFLSVLELYNIRSLGSSGLNQFLIFDQLIVNYRILICKIFICIFLILYFGYYYLNYREAVSYGVDYIVLTLLSITGGFLLLSANNFLVLFLSLELISIPLYILVSSKLNSNYSTEAGLKYLIIGALSSGFILFGLSLIYGFTGVSSFSDLLLLFSDTASLVLSDLKLLNVLITLSDENNNLTLFFSIAGYIFFFFGLFMKMGVAPFHFWMPDVYIGSPNHITLFLMTIQKAIMWFFIFDCFTTKMPQIFMDLFSTPLIFIILFNLILGIFPALLQNKYKNLLVYSSIGGNALLLLAVLSGDFITFSFFLFVYILTTFLSFFTYFKTRTIHLTLLNKFYSLKSLYIVSPLLSSAFTFSMLSASGLPPTIGFISKFYVYFTSFVFSPWLVSTVIASSIAMTFYYFRILRFVYIVDNKRIQLTTHWAQFIYDRASIFGSYFISYLVLFLVITLYYYKRVLYFFSIISDPLNTTLLLFF